MSRRYYFLYKGLVFIDSVRIFFVAVAFWVVSQNGWIFALALFLGVLLFSKRLSYHLVVEDDSTIKEGGFLSKHRSIQISAIHSVRAAHLYFLFSKIGPQDMPMISFSGDFEFAKSFPDRSFPIYPISPRVLYPILAKNPDLSVDSALKDILPRKIRKQLNIKLTVVDIIGLWIWRVLLLFLFLLIAFFASFLIPALLDYLIGLI